MTNHPITFDVDADYNADTIPDLCHLLIGEMMEYRLERKNFGPDDNFGHYLQGLISARMTILSRLGVSSEFYEDEE